MRDRYGLRGTEKDGITYRGLNKEEKDVRSKREGGGVSKRKRKRNK